MSGLTGIQKRLTNVAVVRLKKGGKRFEIACYCNKVISWRNGVEKDMTEVMQSEFVFTNVSKGEFAKAKDMKIAFGTDDQSEVIKIILKRGELQVSEKERAQQQSTTFRDIATIVSQKSVNPRSSRPYTVTTIMEAMKEDLHFAIVPGRSAKQQALDVIKKLQATMPIARARMHIRVVVPSTSGIVNSIVRDLELMGCEYKAAEGPGPSLQVLDESDKTKKLDFLIEPETYRRVSEAIDIANETNAMYIPGQGVQVVELAVHEQSNVCIDVEAARREREAKVREQKRLEGEAPASLWESETGVTRGYGHDTADNEDDDVEEDGGSVEKKDGAADKDGSLKGGNEKAKPKGKASQGLRGQRKSKAAKRREKEEALERKQRKEERRRRVEERQATRERKVGEVTEATDTGGGESLASSSEAAVGSAGGSSAGGGANAAVSPAGGGVGHGGDDGDSGSGGIASKKYSCNTCGGNFGSSSGYRLHFRSDWHRYNLRLKMQGIQPISEAEFIAVDAEGFDF